MGTGTLFIVATPIGNLEDITLRAIRVLKSVDLIAAEDTRRTARLTGRYGIRTAVTSYHDFTEEKKRARLVEKLSGGSDIALVSDAGTPGISDPGYRLVREALSRGIAVSAVPGPSVLTAALSVSGLPTDAFFFTGYLPNRSRARRGRLREMARRTETLVLYETPHRLLAALEDMEEILGERRVAILREMTKVHEESFRGSISEALDHFRAKKRVRGEFTLIVAGASRNEAAIEIPDLAQEVRRTMERRGVTKKEAIQLVARAYGIPKNRVYRESLKK